MRRVRLQVPWHDATSPARSVRGCVPLPCSRAQPQTQPHTHTATHSHTQPLTDARRCAHATAVVQTTDGCVGLTLFVCACVCVCVRACACSTNRLKRRLGRNDIDQPAPANDACGRLCFLQRKLPGFKPPPETPWDPEEEALALQLVHYSRGSPCTVAAMFARHSCAEVYQKFKHSLRRLRDTLRSLATSGAPPPRPVSMSKFSVSKKYSKGTLVRVV